MRRPPIRALLTFQSVLLFLGEEATFDDSAIALLSRFVGKVCSFEILDSFPSAFRTLTPNFLNDSLNESLTSLSSRTGRSRFSNCLAFPVLII